MTGTIKQPNSLKKKLILITTSNGIVSASKGLLLNNNKYVSSEYLNFKSGYILHKTAYIICRKSSYNINKVKSA